LISFVGGAEVGGFGFKFVGQCQKRANSRVAWDSDTSGQPSTLRCLLNENRRSTFHV
jgi:hypothetical protein